MFNFQWSHFVSTKMFSLDGIYYSDSVQIFVFLTMYLKKRNYLSCRTMLLKVSDERTVLDLQSISN